MISIDLLVVLETDDSVISERKERMKMIKLKGL